MLEVVLAPVSWYRIDRGIVRQRKGNNISRVVPISVPLWAR